MASQALIKSGQNLAESEFAQANTSGAAAAGSKLITDQLEKNIQLDQEQEKFKWEEERQNDIRENRAVAKEKKQILSLAEKETAFQLLDEAQLQGLAKGTDWGAYNTDREKWWKDNKTQFLTKTNLGGKLASRLDTVLKAEDNWKNVIHGMKGLTISDSSEEAKSMQFAVEDYFRNNPDKPPQIVEKNGRLVYVIPNPTPGGKESFEIPVNSVANSKDGSDLVGPFDEMMAFDDISANFESQNKNLLDRFRGGKATQEDVRKVGGWFNSQTWTPIQMKEIADGLKLDNVDLSGYDLTDVNEDGVVDGKDIDVNKDGKIDANEKKVLGELFKEVQLSNPNFPEQQIFNAPKKTVDTTFYSDLRNQYDATELKDGGVISGRTSDGEQYSVGWSEDSKQWTITVDGETDRISGNKKSNPPSVETIGNHIGVTGKQFRAFDRQTQEAESKVNTQIEELRNDPETVYDPAVEGPPKFANTPEGKLKYRAWIRNKNNYEGNENLDETPATPVTLETDDSKGEYGFGVGDDGDYTSKQHAGFDKQRMELKKSVGILGDNQATVCGKDSNSQECKSATKKWEKQKAALEAKEEQVAQAKVDGEVQYKNEKAKTKEADIEKAETRISELEGKASQLGGRDKVLSKKDQEELDKLRENLKKLKA